ncbi:uncharacterized protein LOC133172032 [Saccostrea echinata]|uniref:uncharacterized protein LOC133172032 n=1 Tax=Saccostrea echinata TaxID=191078 RepID=UPI002A7F1D85|nr:uncharacterized protein LOC133172032 [Saccostrea echinata]
MPLKHAPDIDKTPCKTFHRPGKIRIPHRQQIITIKDPSPLTPTAPNIPLSPGKSLSMKIMRSPGGRSVKRLKDRRAKSSGEMSSQTADVENNDPQSDNGTIDENSSQT